MEQHFFISHRDGGKFIKDRDGSARIFSLNDAQLFCAKYGLYRTDMMPCARGREDIWLPGKDWWQNEP